VTGVQTCALPICMQFILLSILKKINFAGIHFENENSSHF